MSGNAASSSNSAPELISSWESTGKIKWYDPNKGFGFVEGNVNDRKQDFILRKESLDLVNLTNIPTGATIVFSFLQNHKGFEVTNIYMLDFRTLAQHHRDTRVTSTRTEVKEESGWEEATVTRYFRERGFGFLKLTKTGEPVYVPGSLLKKKNIVELIVDKKAKVRYGIGDKGKVATNLELVK